MTTIPVSSSNNNPVSQKWNVIQSVAIAACIVTAVAFLILQPGALAAITGGALSISSSAIPSAVPFVLMGIACSSAALVVRIAIQNHRNKTLHPIAKPADASKERVATSAPLQEQAAKVNRMASVLDKKQRFTQPQRQSTTEKMQNSRDVRVFLKENCI